MMLHEKAAILTKECFKVVDAASFSVMLRYNCWLALKNVRSGERGMQEKCEAPRGLDSLRRKCTMVSLLMFPAFHGGATGDMANEGTALVESFRSNDFA